MSRRLGKHVCTLSHTVRTVGFLPKPSRCSRHLQQVLLCSRMAARGGCGNARFRDLVRCAALNGLHADVRDICRDLHGVIRYVVVVPPQYGCLSGRVVAVRGKNLVFDLAQECMAFGIDPTEIAVAFGATPIISVPALRFRFYADPPSIVEVKLFFGPEIYTEQRRALQEDVNRGGRGGHRRAGVMLEGVVKDGLVFTTSEKHNQTALPTEFELMRRPSPCLWWPCLVSSPFDNVAFKKVRCWEQNLRHSAPWTTPSARVHEFPGSADDVWIFA